MLIGRLHFIDIAEKQISYAATKSM